MLADPTGRVSDGSGRLAGGDTHDATTEDATHWIAVYSELLSVMAELLDRTASRRAGMSEDARGEAEADDVAIRAQADIYTLRRQEWRAHVDADVALHPDATRSRDHRRLRSEKTRAAERELREGVSRGEFVLRYQPKVDSCTGRVVGVEALLRWNHPVRGLLTPDAFLALAEESGVIVELDAWVLQTACRQASAWARSTLGPLSIAVNISGRDLEGDWLLESVRRVLGETGLDPGLLELELTESAAVQQEEEALSMLREIRALGVRIAIDDFGTGYSMLGRLQDFPFDTLKIDRSLISRITTLDADSPIVSATVAMARGLGLDVVAEGVETVEQRMYLVRQGGGQLQGFLISRAVEPQGIPPMLRVAPLAPIEDPRWAALESAMSVASTEPALEDLVRGLLVELQRLTGLDSVYLTCIHWDRGEQEVMFSRNSGSITVPEGLILPWPDTLFRSALIDGPQLSDRVPVEYPHSRAATTLGEQTSVKVPVLLGGRIFGTLCGASGRRVSLAQPGLVVMRVFASLIGAQIAAPTVTTPPTLWSGDPLTQ
jgi:EAL domain-containing protein (putative c-di-GMP-specific phosphodiesterase class I)